MPIYEYFCSYCESVVGSEVRRVVQRHREFICPNCGEACALAISTPHAASWNPEERFHNLSKEGDGTMSFPTREAYDARLKELDVVEIGGPRTAGISSTVSRKTYPTVSPPEKQPPRPW